MEFIYVCSASSFILDRQIYMNYKRQLKFRQIENKNHRQYYLRMLGSTKSLKLQQQKHRIIHLLPVFNDSFVMMIIQKPGHQAIYHLTANGKVIAKKQFLKSNLQYFAAISSTLIVFLHALQQKIIQWDLQTHQLTQIAHKALLQQSTNQLFIFPQSNYLCISEQGGPDSQTLQLTYYSYPIHEENPIKRIKVEKSSPYICSYSSMVKRSNLHSQVVWFKSQFHKGVIQIDQFELKSKEEGQKEGLNKWAFQFDGPENAWFDIFLYDVWEISEGRFMACAITNRERVVRAGNIEYPNSIFICDKQTSKFYQSKLCLQGVYRVQILDTLNMGQFSMIRTFNIKNKTAAESPIYIINNSKQEIVHKLGWTCNPHTKYETVAYHPNLLIQIVCANFINEHTADVDVKFYQFMQPNLMYAFIMEEALSNGVDADLIWMVLQIIQLLD